MLVPRSILCPTPFLSLSVSQYRMYRLKVQIASKKANTWHFINNVAMSHSCSTATVVPVAGGGSDCLSIVGGGVVGGGVVCGVVVLPPSVPTVECGGVVLPPLVTTLTRVTHVCAIRRLHGSLCSTGMRRVCSLQVSIPDVVIVAIWRVTVSANSRTAHSERVFADSLDSVVIAYS